MAMAEAGYVIHQDVLSSKEIDRLLDSLASSRSMRRSRAGSRHLMSEPAVRQIASDHRMIRLASDALGAEALPYRATLFEKTAAANWLVVWHQDTALALQSEFDRPGWGPWSRKDGVLYAHAPAWALLRIVALRIHLDTATADNGPLRVLPGTHLKGVMSDADIFKLARKQPHIDCLVGRGGVMTMSPLLAHSSTKAISKAPRRVLHLEYADSLELAPGIDLVVV
jgi:ectoine hydroxylase-related dioxygenase (phytanoyl-CoA dioxygenase family)